MRERTILTFQVDTLHSLMTAVGAAVDTVKSHERELVNVRLSIADLGGGFKWLKLVECNTNTLTYYELRLEQSDG